MKARTILFGTLKTPVAVDLGLLALRLGFGLPMALAHGWPKLQGYTERAARFADPIGVGPEASLALAIFGELVCGLLLALGLFSRLAAIPLVVTMAVACFIVNGGGPFGDRELALCYLIPFAVLLLTGPGRFSLDFLISKT